MLAFRSHRRLHPRHRPKRHCYSHLHPHRHAVGTAYTNNQCPSLSFPARQLRLERARPASRPKRSHLHPHRHPPTEPNANPPVASGPMRNRMARTMVCKGDLALSAYLPSRVCSFRGGNGSNRYGQFKRAYPSQGPIQSAGGSQASGTFRLHAGRSLRLSRGG